MGEEQAVAKFSWQTLGQWLPSFENTSGTTPKLEGYVRPVFEVHARQPPQPKGKAAAESSGGTAASTITPNTAVGSQQVLFFLCKKVDITAGAVFALM